MRLATVRTQAADGTLVVVADDHQCAVSATGIAPSLLDAVRRWADVESALRTLSDDLDSGRVEPDIVFDPVVFDAPLPRSPQWLDGSAFLNHPRLMQQAFNTTPAADLETIPLMYQGASDDFLSATADVGLPSEDDDIDFEGEFAVVVGDVAMGTSAKRALDAVRLVVQLNDWSLRAVGPREMATGFGFLHAKPSTAFAPIAVTPDELGPSWNHGRVELDLTIDLNGVRFGSANGREMNFHFGQLIAHAARTRRLTAGTIVGSGTVSNADRSVGSSCIAERRVLEIIEHGRPSTPFMKFGDRVRMEARPPHGAHGPFGVIDQRVVDGGSGRRAVG